MNQNYGNGDMEIYDSNGARQRVPLTNIQTSNMPNMGYKDWQYVRGEETQPAFILTGLTLVANLGWAILGATKNYTKWGAAAGIVASVLPIIWPADNTSQDSWKSIMAYTEQLVNQKIEKFVTDQAIARLTGLQISYDEYVTAVNNLKTNPTNSSLKEEVRRRFTVTDNSFDTALPLFAVAGYEVPLVTTYVQAANLHLLLLRDAVMFGETEWGLDPLTVNAYYNELIRNTQKYTDYCVKTIKDKLTQLSTQCVNIQNCDKYPWVRYAQTLSGYGEFDYPVQTTCLTGSACIPNFPDYSNSWMRASVSEYAGTESWNNYNDFRRDMTQMVLDVVALWITFDPRLYPKPVTFELTREIYTSISGNTFRKDQNQNKVSAIENRITRSPHLFQWLKKFEFYYKNRNDPYTAGDIINGLKLYTRTALGDEFQNDIITVKGKVSDSSIITWNPSGYDITRIDTKQWLDTRWIKFWSGEPSSLVNQGTVGSIQDRKPTYYADESWNVQDRYNKDGPRVATLPIVNQINPDNPSQTQPGTNGHRVSWLHYEPMRTDSPFGYPLESQLGALTVGWTHTSVDKNNTIQFDTITSIPAVKGFKLYGRSKVIKGPGSTGGDLVEIGLDSVFSFKVTALSTTKSYKIRIRYASNVTSKTGIFLYFRGKSGIASIEQTYSGTDLTTDKLTYNVFRYTEFTGTYNFPSTPPESGYDHFNISSGPNFSWKVIIDKIEFIPIEGSVEEYEANQKLEKARKVVNALFSDAAKQRLKDKIMGADLDIAMGLIEEIPDDRFSKEKMILRDRIKQAKRMSQSRNLLQYGDFASPDWSGENGWTISNSVSVEATNPILNGKYLNLPSARDPLSDGNVYPSYAYQKVDESKLKPYTRYWIRGLIGSSKDLELIVSRYRKEVHKTWNVPDNLNLMSLRSHLQSLSGPEILEQVQQKLQDLSCGTYSPLIQINNQGEDPHIFSCHIDVGELDLGFNPGIEVTLKINSVDGSAQIRHIELIEGAPLTSEEMARVKRQEKKWKQKRMQIFTRDQGAIQAAQEAINRLFVSPTCGRLKLTTTLQDIEYAQKLVNAIPDRYNPILSELPGVNMDIFGRLQNQLGMARGLYDTRNVVIDGDFMSGLANWNATEGAEMQQIDGTSVVVISDWGANVSQELCVNPDHGYLLRVTARKEGLGKGYVTISDCTENNTETVKFVSDEERMASNESLRDTSIETASTGETPYVGGNNALNIPSDRYGGNTSYAGNTNRNYPSESFGFTPYGDQNQMMNDPSNKYEMNVYANNPNITNGHEAGCGCGCRTNAYVGEYTMTNTPSNKYERNAYPTNENNITNDETASYSSPMPAQSNSFLSGYVTKTVGIFPETNRVRIEMGETEGTFMIESVELIRMEC